MLGSKIPSHLGYRRGIVEKKQDSAHLKDKGGGTWVLPLIRRITPPAGFLIFYHRPSRKIPGFFVVIFDIQSYKVRPMCCFSCSPLIGGSWLQVEATRPKFEGVDLSFGVTERLGFNPRVSCLANSSWSIGLFLCLWALKKPKKKTLRLTMINMFIKILFNLRDSSWCGKKNPRWPLVCCNSK